MWVLGLGIGLALIVGAWTARNWLHFHKLIPVSNNGGANFWIGSNPLAYGGFLWPRDPALNPLIPLIGDEVAVDELGYHLGLEWLSADPPRWLGLMPAKIFYLFNSSDTGVDWNRQSALAPDQRGAGDHAYALTNLTYILLALLALIGLAALVLLPKFYPLAWIGVAITVYWTLIHLPFFGLDRFNLPLLPVLSMYAAAGLLAILGFDQARGGQE